MKFKDLPELKTRRLHLRKLTALDWKSISYLRSDKAVNQFVRREAAETREKAISFIQKTDLKIGKGKLFYWCIALQNKPEMIGSICLWNFSEDKETAEVGYDLKPIFQGQGIMNEALCKVVEFGFKDLDLKKIEAFTQKNNKASIKLLERNLFRLNKGKTDADNPANLVFELINKETPADEIL